VTHVIDPLSHCDETSVYYEELVARTFTELVKAHQQAQEELRGMFGAEAVIDEMALMFRDPDVLRSWVDAAVRIPGVTLFNTAHDSVGTQPIPGRYSVHYWFLSVPEVYGPWRVEAMFAHPGSPLHDSLRRQGRGEELLMVHASFKCPDEEAYGVATNTLARNGYEPVQKCESTYGRFSYWRHEDAVRGVFLKPRVNLRDAEADGE
jgi:hypothetical protein